MVYVIKALHLLVIPVPDKESISSQANALVQIFLFKPFIKIKNQPH